MVKKTLIINWQMLLPLFLLFLSLGELLHLVFAAQFALLPRFAIACVISHLVANLAHRDVRAVAVDNVSKVLWRRSWLVVVEFELYLKVPRPFVLIGGFGKRSSFPFREVRPGGTTLTMYLFDKMGQLGPAVSSSSAP